MASPDSLSQPPASPAAALEQWMKTHEYNQKVAARALQWKAPELSMVLTGRRPISQRMARDMAETLREVPEFKGWKASDWMELQREYSEWMIRSAAEAQAHTQTKAGSVGVLCDSDIRDAVKAGHLKIEPFDDDSVQPASYDAKPGTITWFRRFKGTSRHEVQLKVDTEVTIAPGESVQVLTKEHFRMPANMVGRLAAPSMFIDAGVVFSFGLHLEPGWGGQAFFNMVHFGDEDVTISAECGIASIEFQFLARPAAFPWGSEGLPRSGAKRK